MNNLRDELIKIRTIFDFDIVKGKQKLTIVIDKLKGDEKYE